MTQTDNIAEQLPQAAPADGLPNHDVELSDVAAQKVRDLLEQEGRPDLRLRIAVQPGGCSGLIYQCTSMSVSSMVMLSRTTTVSKSS